MRVFIKGVYFDNVTLEEARLRALELMEAPGSRYVVTPNPEIVMAAEKDEAFRQVLQEADLVIPDGIGVIYAARILGSPLKERVPGIELCSALFASLAQRGGKVYLLGAKPGIAERAGENLLHQYPGLQICGTGDGYFRDDGPVIEAVNAAKPDLLLVCLGFPRQELWMAQHRTQLQVGLMLGGGGSLDVFAGAVKRAPEAWCRLGLEWLYRLLHQPSRIKRMCRLPLFLLSAIKDRLSRKD